MSVPQPKQSELLQAQVAAFADERVAHGNDKAHLFNNLGEISIGGVQDMTRITEDVEWYKGDEGKLTMIPAGTQRTIATSSDYLDFLRSVGGSSYEGISARADMLAAYAHFAPIVSELKSELPDPEAHKEHSSNLGKGSIFAGYKISDGGKEYVVRISRFGVVNRESTDRHLAGAVLGRGVPHLEQVVAASYEDGVMVAEKMPGKEVGKLTVDDISQISDDQLGELLDTLLTANTLGIVIDPKPTNIFYDKEAGFGVIDYASSKGAGKTSADQDSGMVAGFGGDIIGNFGTYGKGNGPKKTVEYFADQLRIRLAHLEVLNRYRCLVETKLSGSDLEKALEQIDSRLRSEERTVSNYSNPEWVATQVAQDKEWREKQAARASTNAPNADGWTVLSL